jgi:hypothetical protein
MAQEPQGFSRRAFCKKSGASALGVIAFITLGPRLAAAQAKVAQQQVSYQTTPNNGQQCINCSSFVAPKACKTVDGDISPQGWCTMFKQQDNH